MNLTLLCHKVFVILLKMCGDSVIKLFCCKSLPFFIGYIQISGYRNQQILVGLSISLFGFFGFAIYPLCLELSVECAYPVAEATTAGFLLMAGYKFLGFTSISSFRSNNQVLNLFMKVYQNLPNIIYKQEQIEMNFDTFTGKY